MRRLLIPIALVGAIGAAASALAAGATHHQPGVTIEPLAHATIGDKVRAQGAGINLRTKGPRDILTAAITVDPDGSFGWHSHPGPVQVAVASGTLTVYEVHKRRCRVQRFGPGEAFVETGGRVHLARNEGSETVRLLATFLARVGTTQFSRPEREPEGCR